MAVQTFVADVPSTQGKKLTAHAGLNAADTFTFLNTGKEKLIVTAKATETKVKVVVQRETDGLKPAEREVACKEGEFVIGPFDKNDYNNEEEKVEFSLTSAVEIEVKLIKG